MIAVALQRGSALVPTSSQTVGPFVEIGCKHLESDRVVDAIAGATDVIVRGRVIDGDGAIVPDYMLEIWQAIPGSLPGFARVLPSDDGSFTLHTSYYDAKSNPASNEPAPYLAILIFMRGLLKPLLTRMYFPNDPRTATDPVIELVPADRRATLVAVRSPEPASNEAACYLEWNVVLQGAGETAFFEW